MLKRMVLAYRREVRGEGIDDELPRGFAADLMAIWFLATIISTAVCMIWL